MKLLVFGATGATGIHVVQQAINRGVEVTAFVRSPEKLTLFNPLLKIVKGDVLYQDSIDCIIRGHDAIICCLGTPALKAKQLRSVGTKNIISSMEKFRIKRFICQTSLGFGDSEIILRNTPFVFKKIIVPYLLKKTFAEHSVQEKIIRNSMLNYTIVRPGSLTNSGLSGNYHQGDNYSNDKWKVKISRADVAHFLLEQLEDNKYIHKTVGISY